MIMAHVHVSLASLGRIARFQNVSTTALEMEFANLVDIVSATRNGVVQIAQI